MSAEEADVNFSAPVKSVSIENMVRMRAAVIERVDEALAILDEAQQIAAKACLGWPRIEVVGGYRHGGTTVTIPDGRAEIVREIDKHAWGYLMTESGLRTFMDAKARAKWNEGLEKGEIPELTADNVAATFRTMHDARTVMFERGVIECFKHLSWDYKTNNPFRFGKRIVIEWLFSVYKSSGYRGERYYCRSINHGKSDQLDDLVRVFSVLDGKPEPDHRNGCYRLLADAEQEKRTEAEHAYFSIRWFLKGTGHVTFKRPDLVHQLNDIIARHYPGALPAPRGES